MILGDLGTKDLGFFRMKHTQRRQAPSETDIRKVFGGVDKNGDYF